MSTPTDIQAVIDAAIATTGAVELQPGSIYAFRTPGGVQQVDLYDAHRTTPERKTGTTTVRDTASFVELWNKHSDADSEIYADAEALTVTAVLNASGPSADGARYGDHRLTLSLRTTQAWKEWTKNDGQQMPQEAFAEFLEDHLPDLQQPAGAEMLEIAQSIRGTTKAEFASGSRLQSGQRTFQYTEDTKVTAGAKGTLVVPEVFKIGIVPFEGAAGYNLTARLRYRIGRDSGLTLGYKLERPGDTLTAAFDDVRTAIGAQIQTPILNGTPAGSR
jgi:uncharacterized protein YfdQ (DUF2303 family)